MRDQRTSRACAARGARDDAARLVVVGVVRGDGGDGAIGPRRPAPRPRRRRPSSDRAGAAHDLRRGAVVAPEPDDPDVGVPLGREVRGEAHEERGIGAGEPVDRLVAVADDAQVGAVAEPRAERAGTARGLASWNSSTKRCRNRHRCAAANSASRSSTSAHARDEVVEVDEAPAPLLALVLAVDRRRPRRAGEAGCAPASVTAGSYPSGRTSRALAHSISDASSAASSPASRPADAHERHERAAPCVRAASASCAAASLGAATELRERDRVERAGGDRVVRRRADRAGCGARRRPCA